MVKFLLNKPIAVTMTFVAILILGVISMKQIPVSLMPDIDIPEITVQISDANSSARELENTVVRRLRQQLMQVSHLDDIQSETRDGSAIIKLYLTYGSDVDYAFIEVNEKIDRAMSSLPRSVERPRVMKASASDIPVVYLNLSIKSSKHQVSSFKLSSALPTSVQSTVRDSSKLMVKSSKLRKPETFNLKPEIFNLKPETSNFEPETLYPVSVDFVELSRFASNVIRKRLEQLPEVAMVDMSGLAKTEILIMPEVDKLDALGISLEQLEQLIKKQNLQLGNLSIKDGQYLYNIRFASSLQNKRDIENIWFKVSDRMFQLKDVAKVIDHPQKLKGMVQHNGQSAITMAVIKQSDAQVQEMKDRLHGLIHQFERDYPDIQFEITRDQTSLLDYSMSNLQQSLLWGALLAFLVMFIFLRDFKSPLLIGITIPLSLVVSLLFFHLIGLSINIISLSGLILGVGMMIDNSIIVIDNITQHYRRGFKLQVSSFRLRQLETFNLNWSGAEISEAKPETSNLETACISGTNEVIRPMLSSVLTTCAVFIPLIFIKGISGALFYDQAMAIAIGLFASLAVSITVLPVYYLLLYKRGKGFGGSRWLKRINGINYEWAYEKGFRFTMKHQPFMWGLFVMFLVGAVFIYQQLPKSKLPEMEKDELLMRIDWNDRIHVEENRDRTNELVEILSPFVKQHTSLIGEQQFLLDKGSAGNSSEATVYLKVNHANAIDSIQLAVKHYFDARHTDAKVEFHDAGNIFNIVFSDTEQPLTARLRATGDFGKSHNQYLSQIHQKLEGSIGQDLTPIAWQEHTLLKASPERMLLYNVTLSQLYGKLKSLFNENEILLITDNNDFVPVILGGKPRLINDIIQESTIRSASGVQIPIRELLEMEKGYDLKMISAGKEGEILPVAIPVERDQIEGTIKEVKKMVRDDAHFEVSFSGSYFSNKAMIRQLIIILLISLALLYFILASQFESLTLPLIVLLEVPIDLFGAFLFLWIFGSGINLMSLIGVIVMSGIIINDSILKIDTINQLRNQGYSLMRAMSVAGQRRLKPILMTSITTILALVPFLFTKGLGSDLQRPLALAVIGGMIIGTVVSLYFIPLGYYYLVKVKSNTEIHREPQSHTEN